jgi:hypothetical protein
MIPVRTIRVSPRSDSYFIGATNTRRCRLKRVRRARSHRARSTTLYAPRKEIHSLGRKQFRPLANVQSRQHEQIASVEPQREPNAPSPRICSPDVIWYNRMLHSIKDDPGYGSKVVQMRHHDVVCELVSRCITRPNSRPCTIRSQK